MTISLGPDGGDTSKLTLYHDGEVLAKILPDEMKEGVPKVIGN